jgi:mRNA interferase RelE/StbE
MKPGNNFWPIFYHERVAKHDIKMLDVTVAKRIKTAIENKLTTDPLSYGSPLHGKLAKFFKLRVGDRRVIYSLRGGKVLILIIAHRKEAYETAELRLG